MNVPLHAPKPNFIKRSCFNCGCKQGEIFLEEQWDVVGLGAVYKGFRVCAHCGLLLQDPAVPPDIMAWHYCNASNYTNPTRNGQPSKSKIRAVDSQLAYLQRYPATPGWAFQVGCSDGYTLSRFEKSGCEVAGCDPSPKAAQIAKSLWNIDVVTTTFEEYEFVFLEAYDLYILTHVLEHIYDPRAVLEKVGRNLTENGYVFIEVPLLTDLVSLPPGYFQFEHINYFSEISLANLLHVSGFELVWAIEPDFSSDQYPVQRVLARKRPANTPQTPLLVEVEWAQSTIEAYAKQETNSWMRFARKAISELGEGRPCYIWGAGIHTSQLLAKTPIGEMLDIRGIIDGDRQKWGLLLGQQKILSPEDYLKDGLRRPIIISTMGGESEIIKYLIEDVRLARHNIVTFYDQQPQN